MNGIRSRHAAVVRLAFLTAIVTVVGLFSLGSPASSDPTFNPRAEDHVLQAPGFGPGLVDGGLPYLESHARQQLAGLRGVPDDSRNVLWSRGELRADMFIDLLHLMEQNPSSLTSDQRQVVSAYSDEVVKSRIDLAQGAIDQYNKWKADPCSYHVPIGDPDLYLNGEAVKGACYLASTNSFACSLGYCEPQPPTAAEFTEWADGKHVEDVVTSMARQICGDQNQVCVQKARLERQSAYSGLLEGIRYLIAKKVEGVGGATLPSSKKAAEEFQNVWVELGSELGGERAAERIEGAAAEFVQSLIEGEAEVEEGLASALAETWDNLITPAIAAATVLAVRAIEVIHAATLPNQLEAALSDAKGASLTSLLKTDDGIGLVLDTFMETTLPDWTDRRFQDSGVPPDPSAIGLTSPTDEFLAQVVNGASQPVPSLIYTDWADRSCGSVNCVVTTWLDHGWFVTEHNVQHVSVTAGQLVFTHTTLRQYSTDINYTDAHGDKWRAWLDGTQFLTQRIAADAGTAVVFPWVNGCGGYAQWTGNDNKGMICVAATPVLMNTTNFNAAGVVPFTKRIAVGDRVSIDGQVRDVAAVAHNKNGQVVEFITSEPFTTPAPGQGSSLDLLTDPKPETCQTSSTLGQRVLGTDCNITAQLTISRDGDGRNLQTLELRQVSAQDDTWTIPSNIPGYPSSLTDDVRANDSIAPANDNIGSAATVITGPAHGTLTFTPDGKFSYVPDVGFGAVTTGIEKIVYQLCPGPTGITPLGCPQATATIRVEPRPPIFTVNTDICLLNEPCGITLTAGSYGLTPLAVGPPACEGACSGLGLSVTGPVDSGIQDSLHTIRWTVVGTPTILPADPQARLGVSVQAKNPVQGELATGTTPIVILNKTPTTMSFPKCIVLGQPANFWCPDQMTVGQPIKPVEITASGAPAPHKMSVVKGTLPDGVTFTDSGPGVFPGQETFTLAGTPKTGSGGGYVLQISADNGLPGGAVVDVNIQVHEDAAIVSADSAILDSGLAGESVPVTAVGSKVLLFPPSGCTPSGGGTPGLPPGTQWAPDPPNVTGSGTGARIIGTPTTSGRYGVQVTLGQLRTFPFGAFYAPVATQCLLVTVRPTVQIAITAPTEVRATEPFQVHLVRSTTDGTDPHGQISVQTDEKGQLCFFAQAAIGDCTFSFHRTGQHTVTATWSPTSFTPTTGYGNAPAVTTVNVLQGTSAVTTSWQIGNGPSNAGRANAGDPITVDVSVSAPTEKVCSFNGPCVTPTGTAQVLVDGATFGPPIDLKPTGTTGVAHAALTATDLAAGIHTIAARWDGDSNLGAAQSAETPPLEVDLPAQIVTAPHDLFMHVGDTAAFTVASAGVPAPELLWQESTDGGRTWANIPGATAPELDFVGVTTADQGATVRVTVTNNTGNETSDPATLNILTAPTVTRDPQDATSSSPDQTVTFSAAAAGVRTPDVQWQTSTDGQTWTDLPGATAPQLDVTAASEASGSAFRAVFTNTEGTATSAPAVLTVS